MSQIHFSGRRRAHLARTAAILALAAPVAACTGVSKPHHTDAAADVVTGAPSDSSAAARLPESLRQRGKLVVAIDPTYPPFETLSKDQKTIVGLDADLLAEIGKELGVRIEFARAGFDSIIPGLAAGRYDLAISGMTDTAEREKQVDFVDYFDAGGALVLRKGDPTTTADLPLALCGKKVGVQTGTITVGLSKAASQKCTAAGRPVIDLQMFPSVPASVLAMSSGRVSSVWTDSVSGAAQVRNGGDRFTLIDDGSQPAHTGIALPKGSSALTDAIRAAVQAMVDDGRYRTLLQKYGLLTGAVEKVEVNGAADE
jgi:polar amino acid transport system substrate-binding protein